MKKATYFVSSLLMLTAVTTGHAEEGLVKALTGGDVSFTARLRYEAVSEDNQLKDADATTLRTTLGYKTGLFHGLGAFVEMEDVTDIGGNNYEEFPQSASKTYSVVVDPDGTEVNQAYLSYRGFDTEIRLGRQEITYRDAPFHRFIGNVLWRQNHQSFDAFSLVSDLLAETRLSYAYVSRVNTIFGDDLTAGAIKDGQIDMNSHLFNVQYKGLPIGILAGYGYFLDYQDAATVSTRTLGARLSGSQAVSDYWKVIYTAEHARQDGYRDGAMNTQNYYLAELGTKYKEWQAKLSYELQEGNGIDSFNTPLGTNHAFQGWADIFLSTPKQGLNDIYLTVSGAVLGTRIVMVYHDYETDQDSLDAGEEWDFLIERKFMEHYTLGIKYSDYKAGIDYSAKVDTKKLWLFGMFEF